jgi:tetratricopeptide (TPR) repeat protein
MLVFATALMLSALALAQTGPIEGTVKVKGPDGTKPVAGATVNIYRTDIKGNFDVKTDKQGHYVRLGMPLQGVFLVVASGPGMQPTWVSNVRLAQQSVVDIVAEPGDGSTLTYEQVMAQVGGKGANAPAGGAPQPSAADRAKAEKDKAEYDKAVKESQALQANFDTARNHYNTGIGLMQQSNYAAALPEFEAAKAVETGKHIEFLRLAYKANANAAEANYQLGVEKFNKKDRDGAKPHFEQAIAASSKAIELASTDTAPEAANDQKVYYDIYAKNTMLLIEFYGQTDKVEQAIKMFDKAEALDPTSKAKWELKKGDAYRLTSMQDEAAKTYEGVLATDPKNAEALYKLGLTYLASTEKEKLQKAANYLAQFIAAAPEDKRVPEAKSSLQVLENEFKVKA